MTGQLRYFGLLIRSVLFGASGAPRWVRTIVPAGLLLLAGAGAAIKAPVVALGASAEKTAVDVLLERAAEVDRSFERVEVTYAAEIEPIERVLLHYKNDTVLARRIATSLVKEGRRAELAPDLLLAVLLVENPMLDPGARSSAGALGLMQVMPLHKDNWKKCAGEMRIIETNICYGAQIFRANLKSANGDVERALLRYNGCVRGTNTPNCGQYPLHVYARAGRATILARTATRSEP